MDQKKTSYITILLIVSLFTNAILALNAVKPYGNVKAVKETEKQTAKPDTSSVLEEINPEGGYEIDASYGDLGPKMLASGVIDLEKFKQAYSASGQDLSEEQIEILTKGSNKKIKIDSLNSKFVLNFFWAVGLAQKSVFLDKGDMMKYGGLKGAGGFASTGGWTLAKGDAMKYYSKAKLITLTAEQVELVDKVASNVYRPCCDNSTAFPDCNHGMALLGILELMAGNGATEEEMFQASKYFNAFWFPGNYTELALYFKEKEGLSFKDIDPRVLLSKEYSSATGWQTAKLWLSEQGIIPAPAKGGGGCGV